MTMFAIGWLWNHELKSLLDVAFRIRPCMIGTEVIVLNVEFRLEGLLLPFAYRGPSLFPACEVSLYVYYEQSIHGIILKL